MKKLFVVSGLVLAVFIAGISETSAQTMYSCVNKKSGAMRYVSGSGLCKKSETQISWTSNATPGFDVSKLYTISQQYNQATCLNDDVSISCSAWCDRAPYNSALSGVLETIENFPLGVNQSTEVAYTYDDKQPGTCRAWCTIPDESTINYCISESCPTYLAANIMVICLPRP